jgi:AcrR family transcriptional regulator
MAKAKAPKERAPNPKQKILAAARAVFQAHGVAGLSALDIATALSMSPGHLYYHFKGKGEIALALAEAHEAEIAGLIAGYEHNGPAAFQTHLHILVEECADSAFLYADAAALAEAYPALGAFFRRVLSALEAHLAHALSVLERDNAAPAGAARLAKALALQIAGLGALHKLTETRPMSARERNAAVASMLALQIGLVAPRKKARSTA